MDDRFEVEPSDASVKRVARRVLDRLPDLVVRLAVSQAVSSNTERLVREEIARIKAAETGQNG